jgi:hypothetical protein
MSDCSGQQIVILATIWWWQKLGRLAVSKQTVHRVHMERFNLKKLNELEGKEQYGFEISNRFSALEILDIVVDINRTWKAIRENIKISAKESLRCYELKKCKTVQIFGNNSNKSKLDSGGN